MWERICRGALVALCASLLLLGCAVAETYGLEEALALVGTQEGRAIGEMVELSEDFGEVDPLTAETFRSDGGKSIILWRESAEKEFEVSKLPFADDYAGKDIGEGHTYLCTALMERMPEEMRAKTPDEVENVLVIEARYILSGVITSQIGEDDSDIPSPEEVDELIASGEKGDDEPIDILEKLMMEYRPVFDCIELSYLYNVPTGSAAVIDYRISKHSVQCKNPEAADLWNNLSELEALIQAGESGNASDMYIAYQEGIYGGFLEDSEAQALEEKLLANDSASAVGLCGEYLWGKAEGLKALDPLASDLYDKAISARNYDALAFIANQRAYGAVSESDDALRLTKAYLGQPNADDMREMLQEAADLMDMAEWDMQLLSDAVSQGS